MPPRRTASPRGAAGVSPSMEKRFVDYKMEAAPTWDGEQPETKYKEYARNLKLWLIEATERLPGSLIGEKDNRRDPLWKQAGSSPGSHVRGGDHRCHRL